MSIFSSLVEKVYTYFNPNWDFQVDESVGAFRAYLNGDQNPIIRMYVSDTKGSGHHGSTVGLLRQLANPVAQNGFAYTGTIQVYYYADGGTLGKLQLLMPELKGETSGTIVGATVDLVAINDGNPPADEVNLGFTGGADDRNTPSGIVVPNFAKIVNTKYFLRLQPYKWTKGENQIQFKEDKAFITLTDQRVLGYSSFGQRAYFLDLPITISDEDWKYYFGTAKYSKKAETVSWITSQPDFDYLVVYGINNGSPMAFSYSAEDRMFEAILTAMASQRDGGGIRADARPIVVVSLGNFHNSGDTLQGLINGDNAHADIFIENEAERGRVQEYRRTYLQDIDAANRIQYEWNSDYTSIKGHLDWLEGSNDRVLFVQLGGVPKPLYNLLLQETKLPPIFEGQGTTNDVLNMGKYYIQPGREGKINYPTTVIGYSEYKKVDITPLTLYIPTLPLNIQSTANDMNYPIQYWPANAEDTPGEVMGAYIKEYLTQGDDGNLRQYFNTIAAFYQDPNNDKFRYAVGFLNYIITSEQAATNTETGLILAAADESVLAKLLQQLNDNLEGDGTLKLFPGAISGGEIFDFFTGLLDVKIVTLSGAKITPSPASGDPTSILVTGSVDFLGTTANVDFTFTAPEGIIVAESKFTIGDTWEPEEVPWFRFSNPYFKFTIVDAKTLTSGGFGGKIEGIDADLSFQLPIKDNMWQLVGDFEEPLSIAKFYQLAGGINLTESLPSPFNALSGFGVSNMQLTYDYKKSNIDYVGFAFSTDQSYELMSGVVMESVNANVTIQNPGAVSERKTNWSISGVFKIGSTDQAGVVAIGVTGPELVFSGDLKSGVIEVVDLFNIFLAGAGLKLPSSSPLPQITGFHFLYDVDKKMYEVNCDLNTNWPIEIAGTTFFTVNTLGVSVSGQNAVILGGLEGNITILPDDENVDMVLALSASYESATKIWKFNGEQISGQLSITGLLKEYLGWDTSLDISIAGLGVDVETSGETGAGSSWEFRAQTADPWVIPIPFGGSPIEVTGNFKMGYHSGDGSSSSTTKLAVLADENGEQKKGRYGAISADIEWNGIELTVFYNFEPDYSAYGIIWENLTGKIEKKLIDGKEHQIATLKFTESTTIGSMVETMVGWALGTKFALSSPWDFLNSIPLNNLSLEYDFTSEQVKFNLDLGSINLGFATINSIGISYNSNQPKEEDNGVMITLDGTFLWQDDKSEPISWDASKPETAPSPNGQGSKYLDLRMLALGQHVTFPEFADAKTVQLAVKAMEDLPAADPDTILEKVVYDENSSWLVGMDFGVLKITDDKKGDGGGSENGASTALVSTSDGDSPAQYFITLQTIFNDPNLYALRIALEGDMAKVLAGLDFQIMYRKISDTVGVYSAEITLPDLMRKIQMGQFNITLPVFGIEIYTNGDFQVDIGFPWNYDFSRSLTFQTIIIVPPGIPVPVMGSLGVYFGKLSSATTDKVPTTDLGTFNPVLVFGIGFQIGIGYEFTIGILKAGFSLTAVAILEGVIATWNPYQLKSGSGADKSQLDKSYFYAFKGTVGIIGKLYGSIDFAIIKADVNIDIKLLAQISIAAYEDIDMALIASVDVSVSVKINLGLFKIKISFSFSASIHQTVTINGIGGTAPWFDNSISQLEEKSSAMLLRRARLLMAEAIAIPPNPTMNWSNLKDAASPMKLTAYAGLGLTAAQGEATKVADQVPCYVSMLFIDSVPPSTGDVKESIQNTMDATEDTSFEMLVKQVFRWVIAATQSSSVSAADVDEMVVTDVDLENLYNALDNASNPVPIPTDAIEAFLTGQFKMEISSPTEDGETDATYFPVALDMELDVPAYGDDYDGYKYTYGKYNSVSDGFLSDLRQYFDDLAVKVQEEDESTLLKMGLSNDQTSMADFIFGDYFLLIARQMIQSSRDALRDFKYPIESSETVNDIIKWVNENNGSQEGAAAFTMEELFGDNVAHALNSDKEIYVSGSKYTIKESDTYDSIAAASPYNGAFSGADLATANSKTMDTLVSGVKITYQTNDYIVQPTDSLQSIADALKIEVSELISGSDITSMEGLLAPVGVLEVPDFKTKTVSGDTLQSFAGQFNISATDLSLNSNNGEILDLFATDDDAFLDIADLTQFAVGELIIEVQRSLGLQHLSGMASRYYLAGMRLPTDGITPNYPGMWVKGSGGSYTLPKYAGLYALTGQQFPAPKISADKAFEVTLNRGSGTTWYEFIDSTSDSSLTISIAEGSEDAQRLEKVSEYAQSSLLDTQIKTFGPQRLFKEDNGNYPLTTDIPWESASPLTLPYGAAPEGNPSINMWMLPSDMLKLPDLSTRAINPTFKVQVGQYNSATRTMINTPIKSYGWASKIDLTIKVIPVVEESPTTKTTYEIVGASDDSIVLLERLLSELGEDNDAIQSINLTYKRSSSTSSSTPGVQTDPYNSITMGIAQVNLSTETKPGDTSQLREVLMAGEESESMTMLNDSIDFLRLIWQASITRAGGYYLYYFDGNSNQGLPSRLFNDKGEASISIVAMYNKPADASLENTLTSYMNAFVSGDAIDTTNSQVFAEANPLKETVKAQADDSLMNLAYRYFGNVGDVASDNKDVTITTGVDISVTEGTYEVGGSGTEPGGELDKIAAYFGVDAQDIKDANPKITDWASALPLYTALYLPSIKVTVGTSKGGSTLASISEYYGQNLTALASHNQEVSNIFTDQELSIQGGPKVISATVPAGVVGMEVTRTVPAEIPDDPTASNFGEIYLQNMFSSLAYQVVENPYFNGSNLSLPAGPSNAGSDQNSMDDKIRVPNAAEEGDTWNYQQAIPYSKFSKQTFSASDDMPSENKSPYFGLGTMIQASMAWQDIYGNRLMTELSDPNNSKFLNEPPILTGYTDAIIGLNQWQSVAASWQVNPDNGNPKLEVNLNFDPSTFQGMMKAKAQSATEIMVYFTGAVEQTSAENVKNYSINGDTIKATSAKLQSDKMSVLLTVPSLADDTYNLAIQGIKPSANENQTFDGYAKFSYPDVDPGGTPDSTVGQNAAQALQLYTSLWYQLTDPNGIGLSVEASFIKDDMNLSDDQVDDLVNTWIKSIYLFVKNTSEGQTGLTAPVANHSLQFATGVDQLIDEQIIELSLSFSFERTGGAIAGDFETTGSVKKSTVSVSPAMESINGSTTIDSSAFASNFEASYTESGEFQMQVASGEDRFDVGGQSSNQLWAVRVGLSDSEGISYAITDEGDPELFAPRPISNKLETRTQVPIYKYETGKGIDFTTPSSNIDFTGIDMDKWGRILFASVDGVLTPTYTAAIQLVDEHLDKTYLQQILDAKKAMAEIIKELMIPVYEGKSWDATNAQSAFEQQLLAELSNAYTTKAAVEFSANVVAEQPTGIAPRLYGNVIENIVFIGATTNTDDPRTVNLFFSGVLGSSIAEDVSNYTISDGISIKKAELADNLIQVILTLEGDSVPGTTTITVSADFADQDGNKITPPLERKIETSISDVNISSSISLTSPKLDLVKGEDEPITFLLNSPDIVRGTDGSVLSSVYLNLAYEAASIEHQIGTLPGIEDYDASTWLSFISGGALDNLSAQLGGFDVPLFLRVFPTPPNMESQQGAATNPVVNEPVTDKELSELLQWNYSFKYTESFHYPQDEIEGIINFNLGDSALLAMAELVDAFNQIAEFITVFPSVEKDFNEILATIDADTSDSDTFNNASIALESFVQMINNIVTAAQQSGSGLAMFQSPLNALSINTDPYSFKIKESSEIVDGVNALIVEVVGTPPEGIGTPVVQISGYTSKEYDTGDENSFGYYFENADGVLSAEIGQTVPDRELVIPQMNIFQRQDAGTTVELNRNYELVPGKVSNAPFIYTTGEVGFTNAYRPTIVVDEEIDMSLLGGTGAQKRTINGQLTKFFEVLLENNSQETLSIQMTSVYKYNQNQNLTQIELPIMMQPLIQVDVEGGSSGDESLSTMITNWTTAITKWFDEYYPQLPTTGTLVLEIAVFSNLTKTPMPLLRLNNVTAPMQYVTSS